jgi:6-phosphogluconolactonase
MELHVCKSYDDLSEYVADWMVGYICKTLSTKDRFSIVLTGGNTPRKLYELLASEEYNHKIDWSRANVFIGDERFVPFDDERNNSRMVQKTLLDYVSVNPGHVHFMQTENMSPETSANAYEEVLQFYFKQQAGTRDQQAGDIQQPTFDLVLLGMGDDAHTLSLFPGQSTAINEQARWCTYLWLEQQNMHRITLTPPVVNAAKCVAFFVSGMSKTKALHEVFNENPNPEKYPSQIIKPGNGELHWFVDEAAMGNHL